MLLYSSRIDIFGKINRAAVPKSKFCSYPVSQKFFVVPVFFDMALNIGIEGFFVFEVIRIANWTGQRRIRIRRRLALLVLQGPSQRVVYRIFKKNNSKRNSVAIEFKIAPATE